MSTSSGSSSSRFNGGENRFYSTPARRHEQKQKLKQKQQQKEEEEQQKQQQQLQREANLKSEAQVVENRAGSSGSSSSKSSSLCAAPAQEQPEFNNLDSFLESTTPTVPAQNIAKRMVKKWRNGNADASPYFVLGDLWESFKEWSAYGAGVRLMLSEGDSVIQYYVPYLSAIQLYANSSAPSYKPRSRPGEDSDFDSSRDSSSNGSHTSDTDSSKNLINSSSDDGECYMDMLKFEYFEKDSPYSREPLADKILDLATGFPELKMYRSCDLLPMSWISVAWYPIYRIPTGPTLRDLEACFLTFHPLSTLTGDRVFDVAPKFSLPIFGLASYKFRGPVWAPSGQYEQQRTLSLWKAADNWLQKLKVDHPDFGFFASHNTFQR